MKALGSTHPIDYFLYAPSMPKPRNKNVNMAMGLSKYAIKLTYYDSFSLFLLGENIGGVIEMTVESLTTTLQKFGKYCLAEW